MVAKKSQPASQQMQIADFLVWKNFISLSQTVGIDYITRNVYIQLPVKLTEIGSRIYNTIGAQC